MGLVMKTTKRGEIAGAGWYMTFLLLFCFSDFLVFYLSREFEIHYSLHRRSSKAKLVHECNIHGRNETNSKCPLGVTGLVLSLVSAEGGVKAGTMTWVASGLIVEW